MASIGDLLMKVVADMTGFEATVVKEGEKAGDKAGVAAGKSFGSQMSAGIKANGVKALALGVAGAFAIASKGARDLEESTARFRAETGATADEAARMGKTINRVAGEERMSLQAVTDIAINVKNQMGATGAEADALTKRFAQFARVTGQDGVAAVKAFDDILDSWGLSAADTGTVMDKLIVSQHKFGGDLDETEATLASLAPAMKAANLQIDDGIALLGLFGSKGLDANTAAAAFAKALTKVKSPAELQKLIKDIEETKDPFLRASKAADLFGARAGAKLANALGEANLDDYKISVGESAGALQDAADVLDNTFTGRIAKAISIAQSKLREFGSSFGPALTGLASLASLAGALGGGKFLSAFTGPLKGLAGKGKDLVVNAIMSWVVPAHIAGEAVGVAQTEGVAEGMASSKAMGVAQKALGAVGKVWGSILGKATVLGTLAIIGVELWDQLQKINEANEGQVKDIGVNVGKTIADGTAEGLAQSKGALEKAISDLNGPGMITRSFNAGTINALQAQLDAVNAAIEGNFLDTTAAARRSAEDIGKAVKTIPPVVADTGRKTGATFDQIAASSSKMRATIKANMDKVKTAAHELTVKLTAEAGLLIDGYYDPIIAADELRVEKDQVAADEAALAATKAGTAERHQAKLTLAESQKALDQTRLNLLSAGKLSAKDQTEWLKELRKKYKTATGDAKEKIQSLIDKIIALQNIQKPGVTIKVNVTGHAVGHGPTVSENASGGPIRAGELSWVGEKGPELFQPAVAGRIIPHAQAESMAAMSGGNTTIAVNLLDKLEVRSVRDIGDGLRMLERRGYLRRRGGV